MFGSSASRDEVWLVRHGETEWSAAGRHTGRTDIPLSEIGRGQATVMKQRLSGHDFARVLVSPSKRALETCEVAGLGTVAQTMEELREWDYGSYEGRTTHDIRAERPGWLLWTDGVPEGETAEDVGRRMDGVVELVRSIDGDVALFGHGHSLRVLAARWLGLPPTDGCLFALATASVSALGYEREVPVMLRWNEQDEGQA
jgi:probable phosphoglycerate mutase